MKKTALFAIALSIVTLLSSCGGKEEPTPSPTPTPTPTPTPSGKYAKDVAGTYTFYREESKFDFGSYSIFHNGIQGVFTATGDNSLSATFSGGYFSNPVTENFTVGIGEDEGMLHISSVEDKEFYYGDFDIAQKSIIFIKTKDSKESSVYYRAGSVPQRCLASGKYPCVVTKNGESTDWDLVAFAVSSDQTTATATIFFGKKVDGKSQYMYFRGVGFPDSGDIKGEGVTVRQRPKPTESTPEQTATVAGKFNMSTKAFEVTATLSGGDVYKITSK